MLNLVSTMAMAPPRRRKATLHQLKRRLNIEKQSRYPFEMVPGGTLSRMLWIMETHPRSFSGFLWLLQWMPRHTGNKLAGWGCPIPGPGTGCWRGRWRGRWRGSNENWGRATSPWKPATPEWRHSSGHIAHDIVMGSEAMRVDRQLNDGKISHWWPMPHPWLRRRLDRYLPWLASNFDAMLDEGTQEAFERRWIPTELIHREALTVRERAGDPQWWQGVRGGGMLQTSWPEWIGMVMDWVEAEGVDFMSMTPAQALLHAIEWHQQMSGGQHFRSPVPDGVRVAQWPDGAHIDRLVTKDQLRWEGTSMGHCIGGPIGPDGIAPGGGHYWQGVRDGHLAIFSYRDENGIPWVTIEYEIAHDDRPLFTERDWMQSMGPQDIALDEWDVGTPGKDSFPLGAFAEEPWIDEYIDKWGDLPNIPGIVDRVQFFLSETELDPHVPVRYIGPAPDEDERILLFDQETIRSRQDAFLRAVENEEED